MLAISSTVNPSWPSSGPGVGSRRSSCNRVSGGDWTNRPSLRLIRAVKRGKSVRATSGIDASTPTTPASTAPAVSDRLPTLNRYEAMPRARLVLARSRFLPSWLSITCSATQCWGRITAGQRGMKWASATPR